MADLENRLDIYQQEIDKLNELLEEKDNLIQHLD